MGWIVHESDTGFEDGHYAEKSDGEQARENWHERRPDHEHALYYRDKGYIHDNQYLAVQDHLSRKNKES